MSLLVPIWKTRDRKKIDKAIKSVKKIKNQKKLMKVAMEAFFDEVGSEAANRIEDLTYIRELALEGRTSAALTAIRKIDDADLLKEIALKRNYYYGYCAVKKIADKKALKEIAYNAKNVKTKGAAIDRINDQDVLKDIFFSLDYSNRDSFEIAVAVVHNLNEIEMLDKVRELLLPIDSLDAKRVLSSVRERKTKIYGNSLQYRGTFIVLKCDKCGEIVRFRDDLDPDHSSWRVDGEYYCNCTKRAVESSPGWKHGSAGFPLEYSWDTSISRNSFDNIDYFELCPRCMKIKNNHSLRLHLLDTCNHKKLTGYGYDISKHNIVIPYNRVYSVS